VKCFKTILQQYVTTLILCNWRGH